MRACHYRNKMVKQFETWRVICGLDQPATVDHRLTCAQAVLTQREAFIERECMKLVSENVNLTVPSREADLREFR